MQLKDVPDWITANYNSDNMRELAMRLHNVAPIIEPYLEDNFCSNHIRSDLSEDTRDKKFWEGCWHLHMLWTFHDLGFDLKRPYSNDDIIISIDGRDIAIETTFSNWGDPTGELRQFFRELGEGGADTQGFDEKVIHQALLVLDNKELKLINRDQEMPRIVALNEVLLTGGFPTWQLNAEQRRIELAKAAKTRNYSGFNGLIYSFVSYNQYFREPGIDRCFSVIA